MSAKDAAHAGALFYCLPEKLTDDMIDPLLRSAVRRINASGWCWTAESCQGHPDAADDHPWAGNVRPFLRLVCEAPRLGEMLAAMTRAMRSTPKLLVKGELFDGEPQALSFRIYPWAQPHGNYEQVLVYIDADSVYSRNQGVEAFERFAAAVTP
jgi:hypothetical protein